MKRVLPFPPAFGLAACLWLAGTAGAQVSLPEGQAKDLVERACSACHVLEVVTRFRLTEKRWGEVVADMAIRGAPVPADEIDNVIAYLAEHFKPVERPRTPPPEPKPLPEHERRMPGAPAEEAAAWNKIYGAVKPAFPTNPNLLLVESVRDRPPGKALDAAMGEGRNAVFLALRGWEVTGFDVSEKALDLAQRHAVEAGVKIRTVLARDLDFEFGTEAWDLIAILYPAEKRSVVRAREALRPGGLVVVEGFHEEGEGLGAKHRSNELLENFAGFRILRYEDGLGLADWGRHRTRLVRLVAEKPR